MRPKKLMFAPTIVALLAITLYATIATRVRNMRPELDVEDSSALYLGRVQIQEPFVRTLRIVNTGQRTAEVEDVRGSCGCLRISPRTFDLNPGQVRAVELAFDLQSIVNRDAIPPLHRFDVTLVATTRHPHQRAFRWRLHGHAQSVFKRFPQAVELRGTTPRTQPIRGEFEVESHASLDDLRVTQVDSSIVARVHPEDFRRRFRIRLDAAFPEYGERAASLEVAAISSGVQLAPMKTEIVLRRVPDVRTVPAFLNLGVMTPGAPPTPITLRLASASRSPFTTIGFTVVPTDSTPLTVPAPHDLEIHPADNHDGYMIAAASRDPGTHIGNIEFEVRQHEDSYLVLVPYVYHATEFVTAAGR